MPGCEPDLYGYCDHRLAALGYVADTAPCYATHVLGLPAYTNADEAVVCQMRAHIVVFAAGETCAQCIKYSVRCETQLSDAVSAE